MDRRIAPRPHESRLISTRPGTICLAYSTSVGPGKEPEAPASAQYTTIPFHICK